MKYLLPPEIIINSQSTKKSRVGSIFTNWHIYPELMQYAKFAVVGVPLDFGVKVSGGREGAAKAPERIRAALSKLGSTYFIEHELDIENTMVMDFGNVHVIPDNPDLSYTRISEVIKFLLDKGLIPIVIGGSHDISFATIRGLSSFYKDKVIGGINIDSHLDVREISSDIISSGSPFRASLQSINEFKANYFTTIGVTGNTNARSHFEYLISKGSKIITLNQLRKQGLANSVYQALDHQTDSMFLSIDIDVVSQAFAPGCSAPAVIGMNPSEVCELAFLVGKSKKIQLLDIVEVNPSYDLQDITVKLAACILIHFIAGVVSNK